MITNSLPSKGRQCLLLAAIILCSFSVSGCDFMSSIMDIFSSGAGGAAAEATSDTVGGETGNKLGSVAGDLVKDTVKTKGIEYLDKKKEEASDKGTAEETTVKVGGD